LSADKSPLNIYVSTDVKQWFKEHNISPSQFFESAWSQYIDSDIDTKAKILIGRITLLDRETKKLDEELYKTVGKYYKQLSLLESSGLDMRSKEQVGLESLYNAMSEDQKRVLAGKVTWPALTMTHVENWVEARKEDFGLLLPTRLILEKLRNNGTAQALCADKEGKNARTAHV